MDAADGELRSDPVDGGLAVVGGRHMRLTVGREVGSGVDKGVRLCCKGAGHGSEVGMGSGVGMGSRVSMCACSGGNLGEVGVKVRAARRSRMESSLLFKALGAWESVV